MPPKRKAAAKKAPAAKKTKAATPEPADDEGPTTARDAMAALKTAGASKKKGAAKIDTHCPISAQVLEDFDCMLNQTNIGHNNNKYYVIQALQQGKNFYAWNRWGRVGESGQNALIGPFSKEDAIKAFKKKFKDKTRNDWDKRGSFKAVAGKYTLLEMDDDDDDGEDDTEMAAKLARLDEVAGPSKSVRPCTLDKATQGLINLIFDNDMFKDAMKDLEIDVKKMPLGKLSKSQIAKGFEVLEEIERVLDRGSQAGLTELTSKFFTLIPHNFGRQRPPVINNHETMRKKMDMLMVLADIELAQAMQEEDKKKAKDKKETDVPHPLDVNYGLLNCDLVPMKKTSKTYKMLEKYLEATKGGWYNNLKIQEIYEVDRHTEGSRFAAHDKVTNRKLLWHGTNVAVVAAILKSGLRIMPHSGGRVGRGIYFASENGKSSGYVSPAGNGVGIMFLSEVALGKERHISMDDHTLKAAPAGYDSIVARGRTEPDPKHDTKLELEGKQVVVPQGKPINQPAFSSSSFGQSEYLIYKENQCRLRYLLQIKFR